MDMLDIALTRSVAKILPSKSGLKDLMTKKKIKLYQGFDPTGRLHLGHAVGLRKLMQFADLGHEVIFLFGTGTVLVGDPSKRDSKRSEITTSQIEKNIKSWKKQASPFVNYEKIKILKNGEWLNKLTFPEIIKIASNISAIQLFKRDSFQKRLAKGDAVWYHETMYPVLQGYDSVVMDVDLEIGGTDQEFNMLVGRELQKKINKRKKFVLTFPMILGTDGKQMSKSSENCIWLDDGPEEMFGKLMSIADSQLDLYINVLTELPLQLSQEEGPLKAKKEMAFEIVKQAHGKKKAESARNAFEKTFQEKKPEFKTRITRRENLIQTIAPFTAKASISDAKRYISQGSVDVNNQVITDPTYQPKIGDRIKIGATVFATVVEEK